MAGRRRTKRYFGSVRQLPSQKFQARYPCPDSGCDKMHTAQKDGKAYLFDTAGDADEWLAGVRTAIRNGTWKSATRSKRRRR